METRAHHVLVGSFVLGILLCIAGATIWLAQIQFSREFAVYGIYFQSSVYGLIEGAPVRYNGIQVGRVTDLRIDPKNAERVIVQVSITPDTPIKEDSVASLELQGITGLVYVEIAGAKTNSPPLTKKDGEPYPVIPSRRSGLENIVRSAPDLLSQTKIVTDRISDLLSDHNRQAIADTLDNLRAATGALGQRSDAVGKSIEELVTLIRDADTLLKDLDRVLAGKDGVTARLDRTLEDVGALTRKLSDSAGELDAAMRQSTPGFREFGQRGLPDLVHLIEDVRGLVARMTHVTAELERDPSRFLFGDRRQGYHPQ